MLLSQHYEAFTRKLKALKGVYIIFLQTLLNRVVHNMPGLQTRYF
jgi:hypothetical protein